MGLALASAPSITVSLTATGLQKMMSVMATLNLPSRRGQYKVETNQCTEELASIRAQPRVGQHCAHTVLMYYLQGMICQIGILLLLLHSGISEAALPAITAALRWPTAGRKEWRDGVQWDPTRENVVSSLCAESKLYFIFYGDKTGTTTAHLFTILDKGKQTRHNCLFKTYFLKWLFEWTVLKCQSCSRCVTYSVLNVAEHEKSVLFHQILKVRWHDANGIDHIHHV